ncbi:MAG TPA: radical SAM protein, partial [Magnetococcales bacterium]|nr:radical SAM protein [Magnetococcales bacterium]
MNDDFVRTGEALRYVTDRLGFSYDTLRPFPKWFLIETINACNARCVMCGIDFDQSKAPRRMSKALFEKIATEIGQHREHVEKVMVYLDGEPLLDNRLPYFIRLMKNQGVKRVNVATNASLLDAAHATALMEAGLDEIYITLDSLHGEVYESIRVGLKFSIVLENIHRFIALRQRLKPNLSIRMQMVLQEKNYGEGSDFEAYWRLRLSAIDQIVVQKAHNWGSTVKVLPFGDENRVNRIPCIALWGTFVVHADGTVPLCCMDTRSRHPLGDLNEQSIAQLWNGSTLEGYRERHLRQQRATIPICDGC